MWCQGCEQVDGGLLGGDLADCREKSKLPTARAYGTAIIPLLHPRLWIPNENVSLPEQNRPYWRWRMLMIVYSLFEKVMGGGGLERWLICFICCDIYCNCYCVWQLCLGLWAHAEKESSLVVLAVAPLNNGVICKYDLFIWKLLEAHTLYLFCVWRRHAKAPEPVRSVAWLSVTACFVL